MSVLKVHVGLRPIKQMDRGKKCYFLPRLQISLIFTLLFTFSLTFAAAETQMVEGKKNSLQAALQAEAAALKKEAITLHQEVASLERKLESAEKQKKDVLVWLTDATKGQFLAFFFFAIC